MGFEPCGGSGGSNGGDGGDGVDGNFLGEDSASEVAGGGRGGNRRVRGGSVATILWRKGGAERAARRERRGDEGDKCSKEGARGRRGSGKERSGSGRGAGGERQGFKAQARMSCRSDEGAVKRECEGSERG